MENVTSGISVQLVRRVLEYRYEDLSPETVTEAKRLLLHNTTAMLAGSRTKQAAIARTFAMRTHGPGKVSIVGGGSSTVVGSAFANGMSAHATDAEDTDFTHPTHPSPGIIGALFASGEEFQSTGSDLLLAYVLGLEFIHELGKIVGKDHILSRHWHAVGPLAHMGATIVSGLLAGLSEQEMLHGLGLAGATSSSIAAQHGTMAKAFHAAHSNACGVTCALLAKDGLSASTRILEHPRGWLKAFGGRSDEDLCNLSVESFGQPWSLAEPGLVMKGSPGATLLGPAIQWLKETLTTLGLTADDISMLSVGGNRWLARATNRYDPPGSIEEAMYNHKYRLGMTIVHGDDGFSEYTQRRLSEDAIHGMMARIEIYPHPDLEHLWQADSENLDERLRSRTHMDLTLKSGDRLSAWVDKCAGYVNEPFSDEELDRRFLDVASKVIGLERARDGLVAVRSLEDEGSPRRLCRALAGMPSAKEALRARTRTEEQDS